MAPGRFAVTQAQAEAPAASVAPASPPESPGAAPALSAELLESLAPELRPTPETVVADDDAEDAGTPTATPAAKAPDAAATAPDGEDAADADGQPDSPESEVATWADQLLENPQTAARIPKARWAEVAAEMNQRLVVTRDYFYQQGLAAGEARARAASQQQTLSEQAQGISALIDPDSDSYAPELYAERIAAFPGGAKAYHRVVAEMTPLPAGSAEEFTERARNLIRDTIGNLPNAQQIAAELQANWNYSANEAGMQKLAFDLGRLANRGPQQEDPAAAELQKRKAGLEGLRKAPKPDVSEGRTDPITGDPTPEELRKMSPEAVAELEIKNPGTLKRLAQAAGRQ